MSALLKMLFVLSFTLVASLRAEPHQKNPSVTRPINPSHQSATGQTRAPAVVSAPLTGESFVKFPSEPDFEKVTRTSADLYYTKGEKYFYFRSDDESQPIAFRIAAHRVTAGMYRVPASVAGTQLLIQIDPRSSEPILAERTNLALAEVETLPSGAFERIEWAGKI